MLDSFLEKHIKNKLELYSALRVSNGIDIKKILTVVTSSEYNVRLLLNELAQDFEGMAEIKKEQQYYSLHIEKGVNLLKLKYAIYRNSAMLQCLKFFITNEGETSYNDYMTNAYLSRTEGYRVRKKCQEYLNEIGLDIKDNKVVGEEYRIRFLIALLYYTYGIDCCGIDEESIKLARQFILSTNQAVDSALLENAESEYGYFECLLILSWKRKKYLPFSKQTPQMGRSVEIFKESQNFFVYAEIPRYVKKQIEKPLGLRFSEQDYNYIYLAYLCTNNCIFADKWQAEDIEQIYRVILGSPVFSDLVHRIEGIYGKKFVQNQAMQDVLLNFCKKCLFQLQCIIPDVSFYFDFLREPLKVEIVSQMTELLEQWRKDNHIQYQIDKSHILYFSVQAGAVLRLMLKPIRVVVVSDMVAEMEVMSLLLDRRYSSQRIVIDAFLMNIGDRRYLHELENCVIVVQRRLKSVMEGLGLSESNIIVFVGIEMNAFDIDEVEKAIRHQEKDYYFKLIRKRSDGGRRYESG